MTSKTNMMAAALAVAGGLSTAASAQTYSATYDGTTYNFSVVTGQPLPPANESGAYNTPWFGNSDIAQGLALDFANGGLANDVQFIYSYNKVNFPPGSSTVSSYSYIDPTTAAASESGILSTITFASGPVTATAVPEINGSTIPLLAFILGVVGLGLKRKHRLDTGSSPHTFAAA